MTPNGECQARSRKDGSTYFDVMWRQDGRQRSLGFETREHAEKFRHLIDLIGPDKALETYRLDPTPRAVRRMMTVGEWLDHHIDCLTGVNPVTVAKYRSYVLNDLGPVFGDRELGEVNRERSCGVGAAASAWCSASSEVTTRAVLHSA